MTECVRLRATYRYADVQSRDAAVGAALDALELSTVQCAFTLGQVVVVDVVVPLFGEQDYTVFTMLDRGAIESQLVRAA